MPDDLLDRLLACWRETRDPLVEDAIVRVGPLAGRGRPGFDRKLTGDRLEAVWLQRAATATSADLDKLLAVPWPVAWQPLGARVRALARLPPDPRIAHRALAAAQLYPDGTGTFRAFHRAVAKILVAAATPSLRPALDALYSNAHFSGDYRAARAAIVTVAIHPADPALVAEAHDKLGDGREAAELWEAHARAPGDLDLRAVLADALVRAGDPRGELIQLQLAGDTGRRVDQLLASYHELWLSALPQLRHEDTRFARGFPIKLASRATAAHLLQTLDRPEWLTVEELLLGRLDMSIAPLVARLPLLRRLWLHLDAARLADVLGPGPFPQIRCLGVAEGVPARDLFPELAVLATRDGANALEAAAALGVRVMIAWNVRDLTAYAARRQHGPPECRFTYGYDLWAEFGTTTWWGTLYPDRDDADVVASEEGKQLDRIVRALAAGGIRRIRVHASAAAQRDAELRFHNAIRQARERDVALEFVVGDRELAEPARTVRAARSRPR